MTPTGQKTGQLPGYTWDDYVGALVTEHGTLTAVAWKLLEHAGGTHDVGSVERALRRLRGRGQQDGGVWGQRLLRLYGVPASVEERVRWMGLYHSPFNDLPVAICLDQLRVWDRPPVSTSRSRVWIQLGHASAALRGNRLGEAAAQLGQAQSALAALGGEHDVARVELALVSAYLAGRDGRGGEIDGLLDAAERLLDGAAGLDPADDACLRARLVDQRAYQLNHTGRREDEARALALFESLPDDDGHPFASYRRDAGRAWGCFRAGRREEAIALARAACQHAGDGGYTRLRVMGLLMLARIEGPAASGELLRRARAIALRLGDDELIRRVARREGATATATSTAAAAPASTRAR